LLELEFTARKRREEAPVVSRCQAVVGPRLNPGWHTRVSSRETDPEGSNGTRRGGWDRPCSTREAIDEFLY